MLLLNMKQHGDCVKPSTHKEKKNQKKLMVILYWGWEKKKFKLFNMWNWIKLLQWFTGAWGTKKSTGLGMDPNKLWPGLCSYIAHKEMNLTVQFRRSLLVLNLTFGIFSMIDLSIWWTSLLEIAIKVYYGKRIQFSSLKAFHKI